MALPGNLSVALLTQTCRRWDLASWVSKILLRNSGAHANLRTIALKHRMWQKQMILKYIYIIGT